MPINIWDLLFSTAVISTEATLNKRSFEIVYSPQKYLKVERNLERIRKNSGASTKNLAIINSVIARLEIIQCQYTDHILAIIAGLLDCHPRFVRETVPIVSPGNLRKRMTGNFACQFHRGPARCSNIEVGSFHNLRSH